MANLHLVLQLFILFVIAGSDEPTKQPKACIDAKCLLDHEWINIDQPFLDESCLNESGKCNFNISWTFGDGFVGMFKGYPGLKATKKIALRLYENQYYALCLDAANGCSLKRRVLAAWASTIYWHQWGDYAIAQRAKDGVLLKSMWMVNNNYFPTVVAPMFFICHFLNVVTLKKMLIDDKTAIVYHLAEVMSDVASCLYALTFPLSFHYLFGYCTKASVINKLYNYDVYNEPGFDDFYYLDRMPTWEMMIGAVAGLQTANQLFNLFLIISRWYAIAHPMKYRQLEAGNSTLIFVLGTAALSCILIVWPGLPNTATIQSWEYVLGYMYSVFGGSEFGKLLINAKPQVVFAVYSAIYASQVVFGVLFFRAFLGLLRSTVKLTNETAAQAKIRKNNEKQKASLMIGTVIWNWVCMLPTISISINNSFAFSKLSSDGENRFGMLVEVLMGLQLFSGGFNSVGNFFIHLIFTKSYRQAFKSAVVAKIWKQSSQPQGRQSNKVGTTTKGQGSKAEPQATQHNM